MPNTKRPEVDVARRDAVKAIGAGAVAAMTTFALAQPDSASSGANVPLAGSGDAPAYTTYSQPTILHMKVGDTAVVTTPAISPLG